MCLSGLGSVWEEVNGTQSLIGCPRTRRNFLGTSASVINTCGGFIVKHWAGNFNTVWVGMGTGISYYYRWREEISGEVWEWEHLLRNFIYIKGNIVFIIKTNLFCQSVKCIYQWCRYLCWCNSWKTKGKKKNQLWCLLGWRAYNSNKSFVSYSLSVFVSPLFPAADFH